VDKDEAYMHRCLQLAKLGAGNVAPNPMVGAVLVYNDKIIAEGYHKEFGQSHAEVNCINNVPVENRESIEQSTLYVSLEPCSHFGKTPPCCDLIIKNKIKRVVIGCQDANKEVDGEGIKKLQDAGIETILGVLEKESKELNKRFFTFHQKQRPYIILKWAESADGKIGKGNERILISNDYTNRLVHKWRSEEAAILIGTNTALIDDPSLTTRSWKGNNPIRLVIDMDLKLPHHLKVFNKETKTIIFNKLKNEEDDNLTYYKVDEINMLQQISEALYEFDINSIIVEGGAKLLQSFIDAGLWDEVRIIKSDSSITGKGIAAPVLSTAKLINQEKYFTDTISFFQPAF